MLVFPLRIENCLWLAELPPIVTADVQDPRSYYYIVHQAPGTWHTVDQCAAALTTKYK